MEDKVRENRIRRMAERQGYKLQKSRRRDVYAADYGRYWLFDPWNSNALVYGGQWGDTLDGIEEQLIERGKSRSQ